MVITSTESDVSQETVVTSRKDPILSAVLDLIGTIIENIPALVETSSALSSEPTDSTAAADTATTVY